MIFVISLRIIRIICTDFQFRIVLTMDSFAKDVKCLIVNRFMYAYKFYSLSPKRIRQVDDNRIPTSE